MPKGRGRSRHASGSSVLGKISNQDERRSVAVGETFEETEELAADTTDEHEPLSRLKPDNLRYVEGKALCRLCTARKKKDVHLTYWPEGGTTSNLNRHIEAKHASVWQHVLNGLTLEEAVAADKKDAKKGAMDKFLVKKKGGPDKKKLKEL